MARDDRLPPEARRGAEDAWLGILRDRYPDRSWRLLGPDEHLDMPMLSFTELDQVGEEP